ncbi:hypothetical protein NKR23_g10109 [Pleurostoma richardsiae]|uniref:Uncharacterized protein n=1 Tax=Pleurostoma richardsiae TaxID=41990 RepID=A0AA38RDM9_9PEZI|nr:hypothetical protein NKR23_g10109 [Pleurostoma richardsiae]
MAYILFSSIFFFLILVTVLIYTKPQWQHLLPARLANLRLPGIPLPGRDYLYNRLPSTFAGDIEAGLSSSSFDLQGNVEGGDSRAGLDDAAKAEILRIMKKRRLRFDEARKVYMEARFSANGIGPDGRPRDPKFVSFS